mmetsp:Transcript_119671/g.284274  ORF Transcript_119671/g.284274 Transcript_119671/m.284274 type:complete len:310 (-) Transcript_119671:34-963(-)
MPEVSQGLERISLPCGSICGVPIRLHAFLPVTASLAALGTCLAGHPWLSVLLAFLAAGPLLLITVLAHELGHVIAARRCGCSADHILLWPLGGLAFIGGSAQPKEQMLISASGPATHLPMMGLWALILLLLHGSVTLSTKGLWIEDNFGSLLCIAMLNTNLVMMLFNLLVPCFPLDCSRILASLLLLRGCDPPTAAKAIVACSMLALVGVVVLSVWSYLTNHASASLNVILAMWLGLQTWRLHQARLQGQLSSDPLFAAVAEAAPPQAAGRFQAFDEGPALGKPSGSQVCAGAALALWIAVSIAAAGAP